MQDCVNALVWASESYRQARTDWERRQDSYWLLCALEKAEARYVRAWTRERMGTWH